MEKKSSWESDGRLVLHRIPRLFYGTRMFITGFLFYIFLFCTVTNKCTIISQNLHSYMFRHYRVILRELVINTLPSYTNISSAAVGNTIYS
jgi:hypothetical protein